MSALTFPGTLTVTVVSAEGLLNRDTMTSSDPFVVIYHKKHEVKTTPTVTDSLAPTWKASEATVAVELTAPEDAVVQFVVWDKDCVTSECLGQCWMDVRVLGFAGTKNITLFRGDAARGDEAELISAKGKLGTLKVWWEYRCLKQPALVVKKAAAGTSGVGITKEFMQAELGDTFSPVLIEKLYVAMRKTDIDRDANYTKDEFSKFVQDVYFITGTPVPADSVLVADVNQLFKAHDRDGNAQLSGKEMCDLLKVAPLTQEMKQKWKAGGGKSGKQTPSPS